MSKKYEDLSKEELLKKLREFEKELKNNKYWLVWENEKFPEQVVLECENNLPVLEEVNNKEIKIPNCDEDYNILIEWDNYHALTVLNYTHENKIDVIYIDPPYNTGNKDFIYNDHFVDKEDSYRHSKWLNFMEKRLKLARNLLKEDWVIFISIDDNEQAQLKLLCDKIFWEENFVWNISVINNLRWRNDAEFFKTCNEYLLSYKKNNFKIWSLKLNDEELEEYFLEDEYWIYKEWRYFQKTWKENKKEDRPNMYYPIYVNNNWDIFYENKEWFKEYFPINNDWSNWRWTWGFEKFKNEYYNLIVKKSKNKWYSFYLKQRLELKDWLRWKYLKTTIYKPEYSTWAWFILKSDLFDNPKSVFLIKDILEISSNKNSIILDFFAWSWTTWHAVLELNKEDSWNRKFILCTNNQNNICEEVTYKRLEKVMNWYNKNWDWEFINWLWWNLKYFKTSLVKKSKSRSQLKIDITQKCSEMLCLKESIFDEVIKSENYKIFSNTKKDKYLAIYYNFLGDDFSDYIEELKKLNTEIIVYVFSVDNSVDKSLFKWLDVKLEAIPQKILEVYKSLMRV